MFAFFKKLFANPAADWPSSVPDPVFGEWRLDEDGNWWVASIGINSKTIEFRVSGESKPEPAQVTHAQEIVHLYAAFEAKVGAALTDELSETRMWQD